MPKTIHKALKWTSSDPFPIEDVQSDSTWQVVEKSQKGTRTEPVQPRAEGYVAARGTQTLSVVNNVLDTKGTKRKCSGDTEAETVSKKTRTEVPASSTQLVGFKWDNANYSLYQESKEKWDSLVPGDNQLLKTLSAQFETISDNISLSTAQMLHTRDAQTFPWGPVGTDIFALVRTVLRAEEETQLQHYECQVCHYRSEAEGDNNTLWDTSKHIWKNSLYRRGSYKEQSVSAWMGAVFNQKSSQMCPQLRLMRNEEIVSYGTTSAPGRVTPIEPVRKIFSNPAYLVIPGFTWWKRTMSGRAQDYESKGILYPL
ncbi:hypothetical protein C8Q79DRAFT_928827 [Trametes meyenii]|nr:hypothetical protein C8Q79DRAFT_928827 [Trametes meyenii]